MPLIWRAMRIDGDGPEIGRGASLLGVRVGAGENDDINPDGDGCVQPGQGGMSVSPSVNTLPGHRLPRRLKEAYPDRFPEATASNRVHCWWLGEGGFDAGRVGDHLDLRPDPDNPAGHGFVEPDDRMKVEDYEAALAATRGEWRRWEER
jgi:hypothetical protein